MTKKYIRCPMCKFLAHEKDCEVVILDEVNTN